MRTSLARPSEPFRLMGARPDRPARGLSATELSAGGRLRCYAQVFVLVETVVVGESWIVLDLEDADDPLQDVAILVKSHFSRQRLKLSSLDRITDSVSVHWLAACRHTLDRVKNDERGAKVVSHGRYVTFQMAEVAVPRKLFGEILRLIDGLRPRPAPA